jgi:hypothetical protein
MKLKIRRDDASAPETNEWLEMNDWFAELRHDGSAVPGRAAARPVIWLVSVEFESDSWPRAPSWWMCPRLRCPGSMRVA